MRYAEHPAAIEEADDLIYPLIKDMPNNIEIKKYLESLSSKKINRILARNKELRQSSYLIPYFFISFKASKLDSDVKKLLKECLDNLKYIQAKDDSLTMKHINMFKNNFEEAISVGEEFFDTMEDADKIWLHIDSEKDAQTSNISFILPKITEIKESILSRLFDNLELNILKGVAFMSKEDDLLIENMISDDQSDETEDDDPKKEE